MGENNDTADPVQLELNGLFESYSGIVREIVEDEGVSYIPLYESMHEAIAASPGRDFTAFRFRSFYLNAFRQFVLGESLDDIVRKNGWQFHVDGLHLNSRGGMILAELVQEFLDA